MQVRRAVATDISALYAMLKEMHSNTKFDVAPIDDYKLLNKINELIHKGLVLVSYTILLDQLVGLLQVIGGQVSLYCLTYGFMFLLYIESQDQH